MQRVIAGQQTTILADFILLAKKTVSTWIKSLSDAGYIALEFVSANDESKSVVRLIKISGSFCEPITKRLRRIIHLIIQLIIYLCRRFLRVPP